MQTKNLQRYIIWGALAAVCYLMLIQWQKDYGSKQTEITEAKNKETIQQEVANDNKTKNIEDIPQVSDSNKVEETKEGDIQEERYIRVLTPTLLLTIDLLGGDIVETKLPQHATDIETPDVPVTLLQQDRSMVYVAQSGLVGRNGPDASKQGRPFYRAEKNVYQLNGESSLEVVLKHQAEDGSKISKVFTFKQDSYYVNVKYLIENKNDTNWIGNLFAQIKRDNSIDPLADTSLFAMKPFLGIAYWSEESKYNKISLYDIKEEKLQLSHQGGWLAFVQHYFISAWIAPESMKNTYTTRVNSKGENIFGFTSEEIIIAANDNAEINFGFYAGPKDQEALAKISAGLDLTVDYGWLWMIAQMLFAVLIFIQTYVGNWGWSIVLLTCFVKLVFFPLNQHAFKSMANMRKLQPKMQRLKELYGDDRQKLSQATMEMYRKEKINPLGSCLPMLIQMPVFIALYWVLSESVEIRHAEFIGWIKDLSIMDPYFVLPGLMALSMYLQQKLSPMVFQDPMQERIMKMMPFVFAIFFLFFPAGLVLYWLVNNILTIAQQWFINRNLES